MSAPLPFVDWEIVRQRVGESLHVPIASLDSEWDGICSAAAKDATIELQQIFILKGYAVDRITQWDQRGYYASRLAVYFALCRGTVLASYDLKSVEMLDPRKELLEASALVIGGAATAPQPNESQIGGVKHGRLEAIERLKQRFNCW